MVQENVLITQFLRGVFPNLNFETSVCQSVDSDHLVQLKALRPTCKKSYWAVMASVAQEKGLPRPSMLPNIHQQCGNPFIKTWLVIRIIHKSQNAST